VYTAVDVKKSVKSVALHFNPEKPRAIAERPRLEAWFARRKIRLLPLTRLGEADVLITLGGDGTILSIAPQAAQKNVPVLGINTGRLGFMTSIEVPNLYASLSRVVSGKWAVSSRLMLEVVAPRVPTPMLALNDAVIRVGSTTRVTTILASIQGQELGRFIGDGVIVATPTGSTAYSLAAQGPVVHPDVNALVLTPICAHSFSQRPVVYPADQTLEISIVDRRGRNEVQLCLDGQRVFLLHSGDRVLLRRAPQKLQLIHDPAVSYFGILREKLSWGER
jgi:NAD+ kinase